MARLLNSHKHLVVKFLQVEVSLFETAYILPYPGGIPWLRKKLTPVLGETPES